MRTAHKSKYWLLLSLAFVVTVASVGCSTGRFMGGRRASGGGIWYPGKGVAKRWSGDSDGATASLASADRTKPTLPSAADVPKPTAIASTPGKPMPKETTDWNNGNYSATGAPGDYASTGRDVNTYQPASTGGQPQRGFYGDQYEPTPNGAGDQYARSNASGNYGADDPYSSTQPVSGSQDYGYERTADLRGSDQYSSGDRYGSTQGSDQYGSPQGGNQYGSTQSDGQYGGADYSAGAAGSYDDRGAGGSYNSGSSYGNTQGSPASYGGDQYGTDQYSSPAGSGGGGYSNSSYGSGPSSNSGNYSSGGYNNSSQPYTPGSTRGGTY